MKARRPQPAAAAARRRSASLFGVLIALTGSTLATSFVSATTDATAAATATALASAASVSTASASAALPLSLSATAALSATAPTPAADGNAVKDARADPSPPALDAAAVASASVIAAGIPASASSASAAELTAATASSTSASTSSATTSATSTTDVAPAWISMPASATASASASAASSTSVAVEAKSIESAQDATATPAPAVPSDAKSSDDAASSTVAAASATTSDISSATASAAASAVESAAASAAASATASVTATAWSTPVPTARLMDADQRSCIRLADRQITNRLCASVTESYEAHGTEGSLAERDTWLQNHVHRIFGATRSRCQQQYIQLACGTLFPSCADDGAGGVGHGFFRTDTARPAARPADASPTPLPERLRLTHLPPVCTDVQDALVWQCGQAPLFMDPTVFDAAFAELTGMAVHWLGQKPATPSTLPSYAASAAPAATPAEDDAAAHAVCRAVPQMDLSAPLPAPFFDQCFDITEMHGCSPNGSRAIARLALQAAGPGARVCRHPAVHRALPLRMCTYDFSEIDATPPAFLDEETAAVMAPQTLSRAFLTDASPLMNPAAPAVAFAATCHDLDAASQLTPCAQGGTDWYVDDAWGGPALRIKGPSVTKKVIPPTFDPSAATVRAWSLHTFVMIPSPAEARSGGREADGPIAWSPRRAPASINDGFGPLDNDFPTRGRGGRRHLLRRAETMMGATDRLPPHFTISYNATVATCAGTQLVVRINGAQHMVQDLGALAPAAWGYTYGSLVAPHLGLSTLSISVERPKHLTSDCSVQILHLSLHHINMVGAAVAGRDRHGNVVLQRALELSMAAAGRAPRDPSRDPLDPEPFFLPLQPGTDFFARRFRPDGAEPLGGDSDDDGDASTLAAASDDATALAADSASATSAASDATAGPTSKTASKAESNIDPTLAEAAGSTGEKASMPAGGGDGKAANAQAANSTPSFGFVRGTLAGLASLTRLILLTAAGTCLLALTVIGAWFCVLRRRAAKPTAPPAPTAAAPHWHMPMPDDDEDDMQLDAADLEHGRADALAVSSLDSDSDSDSDDDSDGGDSRRRPGARDRDARPPHLQGRPGGANPFVRRGPLSGDDEGAEALLHHASDGLDAPVSTSLLEAPLSTNIDPDHLDREYLYQ
ncbi:hypothetical protein CXG81DRAFT_17904 [Caulochytrium protostelioides]|uniref:Uncharacterized protein n=1 Tax=Caulochytrium protostelioides TaxID=1555241 RepID=A0A4P9XBF3_9FUNG|nr:hypothetical protein CXG81DRAFT_17904 [Caulochytrium protostelioides]|eukprot:RKP02460.1 hypothetical protein CXG81DRAFT_17904 [Caulochytrium protostelioides]